MENQRKWQQTKCFKMWDSSEIVNHILPPVLQIGTTIHMFKFCADSYLLQVEITRVLIKCWNWICISVQLHNAKMCKQRQFQLIPFIQQSMANVLSMCQFNQAQGHKTKYFKCMRRISILQRFWRKHDLLATNLFNYF